MMLLRKTKQHTSVTNAHTHTQSVRCGEVAFDVGLHQPRQLPQPCGPQFQGPKKKIESEKKL